jgi:hypothetical protein
MSTPYRAFPNTFRNDSWKITFSNIPTVIDLNDMKYYDSYVKSFILPDYNMGEIYSDMTGGFRVRHPQGGMWKNKDLSQVQIEFKLSEDMLNYLYLFKWMKQLKYGELNADYDGLIREYNIKKIILTLLDNQKRPSVNMIFTNAFLLNLSSVSLQMGDSSEVTFTTNFSYEEIEYQQLNPMIGNTLPDTPTIGTPCGTSAVSLTTSGSWS